MLAPPPQDCGILVAFRRITCIQMCVAWGPTNRLRSKKSASKLHHGGAEIGVRTRVRFSGKARNYSDQLDAAPTETVCRRRRPPPRQFSDRPRRLPRRLPATDYIASRQLPHSSDNLECACHRFPLRDRKSNLRTSKNVFHPLHLTNSSSHPLFMPPVSATVSQA